MITTPKKPLTRIVRAPACAYGVQDKLVVTICPHSGTLSIREHGRREKSSVTLSLSSVYVQAMKNRIANKR